MAILTRRGDFMRALVGAAVTWPVAARAQQAAMPVVGFLHSASTRNYEAQVNAFREGLANGGFVEGQNVAIEYRWAESQLDRLPALAAELVRRPVAVIAACGSPTAALAAKSATASIPIVFESGADPVQVGLVTSLNHPGGNVTGITNSSGELAAKRVGLLRELVPSATSTRHAHQSDPAQGCCAIGADAGGGARDRAAATHRQGSERRRPRCGLFEPRPIASRWAPHDCRCTLH
jgi:ABC-type uncharacterized transport system substrate-binding protein